MQSDLSRINRGALKAIKCHNKAKDDSRTQAETSIEACDRPAIGSDWQALQWHIMYYHQLVKDVLSQILQTLVNLF